jgi:predicted nucleotidyltransferase
MKDKKKILSEYKKILNENFPGIIDKVILFGSQAEDTANDSSDYDIMVVLNTDYDWQIEKNIYDITYDVDLKNDVVSDIKIVSTNELKGRRGAIPFIEDAITHGLVL